MTRENQYHADLRRQAEQRLEEKRAAADATKDDTDSRRLLYELQVHEIELELQNIELRQTQAKTEQALARYTELYEFAPVGYLVLDQMGLVVECHLAGAALLGVEPQQVEGKRLGLLVKEADRGALANMLTQIFEGPGESSCELALDTDHPHFVRIDACIMLSQPGHCRAVVWDISELKLSQIDLRQRIKEQRCLNRVLALTSDDSRPVRTICKKIAALLPSGLLHEDVAVTRIVLDAEEYLSPAWEPPVAALQRSLTEASGSGGSFIEIGYRASRPEKNTGEGPFLSEERVLLDSVTQAIQQMLKGRRMADEMRHAQRLESVGQLTGGIAHDFNNLLTVIIGNGEVLSEELALSLPQLLPPVNMVMHAAERGQNLTQQLLAFARKQTLEPKRVDVNSLLDEKSGMLLSALGEHIKLELLRGKDLWPTLVDPVQLESSLLNLCLNARDAMVGGGRLIIETSNTNLDEDYANQHAEVRPGDYVLLRVSDSGTGIAPEHLKRIFEPFYTTKEKGKGTGLGLAMVYGFVKQSQGHITIQSEPGKGATFQLYLPRLLAEADSVEHSRPAVDEAGLKNTSETILLVEDDELVRRFAETQLRKLGYSVLTANNGPEALAILRERNGIDLLFTDILMPGGVNGFELADTARLSRPGLRVLFTTGFSDHIIAEHDRSDRDVFLRKPYRRAELVHKLREALEREAG